MKNQDIPQWMKDMPEKDPSKVIEPLLFNPETGDEINITEEKIEKIVGDNNTDKDLAFEQYWY